MPGYGIKPEEGREAVASLIFNGTARTANLLIGLWAGTWDEEFDVTYAEATARFTKVSATGLGEQTITDGTWTLSTSGHPTTASQTDITFTAGAAVTDEPVNGHYLATIIGGSTVLLTVERLIGGTILLSTGQSQIVDTTEYVWSGAI